MSNIYVQEPPTLGKVLLETSVGDIEIELWAKECPKASRNFIQLCLENYYNKTKFFRVIKDFIVQGGDPTNTGKGGESVYEGGTFKDEFHSRLRFVRRGLVAMANADVKDTNGSQFFFTMGQTPELQNKHTIFGMIAGDTIYNAMKLQEGEIDDETPVRPHKIYKTRVLKNPFPDIVPRKNFSSKEDKKKDKKAPESKMKASKDFKLLSFGDEAEEEEEDLQETLKKESSKSSGKSSHDLLKDPKLLKSSGDLGAQDEPQHNFEDEANEETLSSIRDKLKRKPKKKILESKESSSENDSEDEELKEKRKKKEQIQKEIKELKKSMKGDRNSSKEDSNTTASSQDKEDKETEEEKNNELLKDFHYQQKIFKEKQSNLPKKKTSDREKLTMKLLESFKSKLEKAHEEGEELKEEEELKDEDDDSGWMSHKLKFETEDPVLAKDASTKDDDWFDIYDPRNPINKRRRGDNNASKRRR